MCCERTRQQIEEKQAQPYLGTFARALARITAA